MTATASGEKAPPVPSWIQALASQRESLKSFQLEMRTYRFDVRYAPRRVRFAEGEALLDRAARIALDFAAKGENGSDPFESLIQASREEFGVEPPAPQVEDNVHQRDSESSSYKVWEKNSGALSLYDRKGTWQQGDGEISIGPPVGEGEIEVYLAKLGLFVPEFAACESTPDATPEKSGAVAVFLGDLEGLRVRFGCEPWKGHGAVTVFEESPYWEDVDQGVWEKRRWFVGDVPRSASGEFMPALPEFGVEIRYDTEGAVAYWAVSRPMRLSLDKAEWAAFPRERPPFGWTVLDYRFKPAVEYRFGYAQ